MAGRMARWAMKLAVLASLAAGAFASSTAARDITPGSRGGKAGLAAPIWVYNNWSAYDELSDNVPLTEQLALRQIGEIARLRRAGVHLDYYVMDAFWYDPEG